MSRAQKLEERRKRVCEQHGRRAASFRTLAQWIRVSSTTIHRTLTERETAFSFDRDSVMDKVEAALDEIERRAEDEAAKRPKLFPPEKRTERQAGRQAQRRARENPHAGAGLFGSDAA